jgi:hypothetical protein
MSPTTEIVWAASTSLNAIANRRSSWRATVTPELVPEDENPAERHPVGEIFHSGGRLRPYGRPGNTGRMGG